LELHELSLTQAAKKLGDKELSSVELTKAALARIAAKEPLVRAFVTVDAEGALKAAQAADERRARGESGPLLGLPLALKDNLSTKGLRTTCSSRMLEPYVPPFDASVVASLRGAGAVILGKTNLDEFAMGSSTGTAPSARPITPGTSAAFGRKLRRQRRGRGRGLRLRRSGLGHRRLHTPARQPLRRGGAEAHLRPGVALRPGGLRQLPGPDRPFGRTVEDAATLQQPSPATTPWIPPAWPVPSRTNAKALKAGVKGLRVGLPRNTLSAA